MTEIYLDNSATTRPYPEVITLISEINNQLYGNPSSLHFKGMEAEKQVEEARRTVASFFNSREKGIIFTSGGTEANNLAIKGAAYQRQGRGRRLLTSQIEHPSVLNCFSFLEKQGFEVIYLPVNKYGLVDPEAVKKAVNKHTTLVSIMHVNNEVGSIQPLAAIGKAIKKENPAILFHVDAVQSLVRLDLGLDSWQADLVSCSAHKVHGPKGAGALWIRDNTPLQPLLHGGEQERGLRSGTENVPAIAGFGMALHLATKEQKKKLAYLQDLKLAFFEQLKQSGASFSLNGPSPDKGAPHIINLSFPGLKAEVILNALDENKIYVSAGSACHANRTDPSHVLTAMGVKGKELEGAIRFSFSVFNTQDEVKEAVNKIAAIVKELRDLL